MNNRDTEGSWLVPRIQKPDVVSCAALDDRTLTLGAKGLLLYLLTRQDRSVVSYQALRHLGPDGVAGVLRAVWELETRGYLRRSRGQWDVYETPEAART